MKFFLVTIWTVSFLSNCQNCFQKFSKIDRDNNDRNKSETLVQLNAYSKEFQSTVNSKLKLSTEQMGSDCERLNQHDRYYNHPSSTTAMYATTRKSSTTDNDHATVDNRSTRKIKIARTTRKTRNRIKNATSWPTKERFERALKRILSSPPPGIPTSINDSITTIKTDRKIDSNSFYRLRIICRDIIVDKSLLALELLADKDKVISIERPRKWGKTINLDMLRKFFQLEVYRNGSIVPSYRSRYRNLFVGGPLLRTNGTVKSLKIARYPNAMKHQGRYPVVYADFDEDVIYEDDYDSIKRRIIGQLNRLYTRYHPYLRKHVDIEDDLLRTDEKRKLNKYYTEECNLYDVQDSLRFLTKLLYRYFKRKVYVLIDNVDAIVNRYYVKLFRKINCTDEDAIDFQRTVELYRSILRNTFNENPYVEKGFIVGTFHSRQADFYDDVVDLKKYNALNDKYSRHFGFNQDEVERLLNNVDCLTDAEQVAYWYKGYKSNEQYVYSPWSVMQYVANDGILDSYWINDSDVDLAKDFVIRDEFRRDLYAIVAGDTIRADISDTIDMEDLTDRRSLINLLLFTGYLTFIRKIDNNHNNYSNDDYTTYELSCPNEEIRLFLYERTLEERTDYERIVNGTNWLVGKRNLLIESLAAEEIDDFCVRLDRIVIEDMRCDHTAGDRQERPYQLIVTGLLESDYYQLTTVNNDVIILEPNNYNNNDDNNDNNNNNYDTAIVIKFKVITTTVDKEKTYKLCMKEIENRKYTAGSGIDGNPLIRKIIELCLVVDGIEIGARHQISATMNSRDQVNHSEQIVDDNILSNNKNDI